MEPFIALYTAEDEIFGDETSAGEDTASIQPIKMTYTAANPAVPLRLTAVAAQLEMGVKVWILGDRRFGPKNVPDITIDDDEVSRTFGAGKQLSAFAARKADAAGGHGFITELGAPGPLAIREIVPDRAGQEGLDARAALAELVASSYHHEIVYAMVCKMDIDPIFHAIDAPDVSMFNIELKTMLMPADRSNSTLHRRIYGLRAGGVCGALEASTNGTQVGCACADGTVARVGQDP